MSGKPEIFKTHIAQFLVENLNLPAASGVEDAKWEHFQIDHLNDDSFFRHEKKSRQIAWSFLSAMEAVAKAIVYGRQKIRPVNHQPDSIFVSINHEESKEKIRYAKAVLENLEIGGLPKLVIDNQLELEFETGARITSLPSKPPRGRAKANVYLDEFAHVQHDRLIYTAALPVISKGGVIRIGSSTFGASGVFWEIGEQKIQKYPGYTRKSTPWWEVQAFCVNVREARRLAPVMESFERVELFGNDRIKAIFANMPVEDFQQEYEAVYVDETTAWITWNEIQANQDDQLLCLKAHCRNGDIAAALQRIEDLAAEIEAGRCEPAVGFGGDIGRTRNASEFFVTGLGATNNFPLRLMITLENCPFEAQEAVLRKVFTVLPVVGGFIDQNGLGMQLAEKMANEFPYKVRGAQFTNETKKLWATDAKMLAQKRKVPIPVDRDLAYQIHSIKRIVSPSKNLIFDTDRNEKHHADKFWAWALALAAARRDWLTDNEIPVGSYSFGFNK